MMIVDHIAAGILVPHTMKSFHNGPAVAVSILAASLPDLPVLFSGWKGSIIYLSHRGASHSMVLGLIFSLIPVALIYFPFKARMQNSFIELYLIASLSYVIHVFIDLLTPYGTKFLYPFNSKPFSLDLIHCFDPLVIGISLIVITSFLFNIFHKRLIGRRLVFVMLGLYCLYGSISLIRKFHYSHKYRSSLSLVDSQFKYLRTIPRTFWRWKGIARSDSSYLVYATKGNILKTKKYKRSTSIPSSISAEDHFRIFMEYARFPVMEMDGNGIALHNLIYSPISYRLTFELTKGGRVASRDISGFEIADTDI